MFLIPDPAWKRYADVPVYYDEPEEPFAVYDPDYEEEENDGEEEDHDQDPD